MPQPLTIYLMFAVLHRTVQIALPWSHATRLKSIRLLVHAIAKASVIADSIPFCYLKHSNSESHVAAIPIVSGSWCIQFDQHVLLMRRFEPHPSLPTQQRPFLAADDSNSIYRAILTTCLSWCIQFETHPSLLA